MSNLHKRKIAELSLIYMVPEFCNAKENSRLAGLQRKLQTVVLPNLTLLGNFTDTELHEITNKIALWGKETGWMDNKKHVATLVSFCLDMLENSPVQYDKKIEQTLIDLADHLENGKELYPLSCVSGQLAAEKWEKLYA